MLLEDAGLPLDGVVEELDRPLGEELLEPTRIYALDCVELIQECETHTFCHVTGGGLVGNMERVIPDGLVAEMDRASWTPNPIFRLIAELGSVSDAEMEKTFNMGVGMVTVVSADEADRAQALLTARHVDCWTLGRVRIAGDGEQNRAVLVGDHPQA